MSLAVLYRWRVKPGMEAQFVRAWGEGTAAIHARCASYGARLHRVEDGAEDNLWISYARWPSEADRKACFRDNDFRDLGFAAMREAVAETLPEIVLGIADDRLDEPPGPFSGPLSGPPPIPRRPLELGEGLVLRPLDPDRDAAALHAVFGDAASAEYMPSAPHADAAETRRRLIRWETPATPQWAIAKGEAPALGRITLMSRRRGVAEIGVQVVPVEQGAGLARRAVCAIAAYGLGELGLVRVEADVDPANAASVRLFERAGFTLEGRCRNTWVTHLGVADSLIFAATTGWRAP